MTDSYILTPPVVNDSTGAVSLRYISPRFTNNTSYTLRSSQGTNLGTQTFPASYINSISTFDSPAGGAWGLAADSSGNVYVQNSNTTRIFNASGTLLTTISGAGGTITTTPGPDQNTIYWSGGGFFSIFNVSARTFTSYNVGINIWGSVYNPADGFLYVSIINEFKLYKLNPNTREVISIFTNNGTYGLPTRLNDFFQGCTIAKDGNLYCITRYTSSIWKFSITGNLIGSYLQFPASVGQSTGLSYDPFCDCFYATTMFSSISISSAHRIPFGSPESYSVMFNGSLTNNTLMLGSYFNPYTQIFYVVEQKSSTSTVWTTRFNNSLTYSFSTELITTSGIVQLYTGVTPFGISIKLFDVYPCFLQGTKILCMNQETDEEEYIAIEKLRRGDLVKTANHGYKAIELIGHREISNPISVPPKKGLYWFRKSKIPGLREDLCLTGDHCVLHKSISDEKKDQILGHMGDIYITEDHYRIPACLDDRAESHTDNSPATIWHFALENQNAYFNYGVMANGLLVESSSIYCMYKDSNMQLI